MTARELLLPLAIGASAVPIIAFAPLMNNWFGVLNPLSKMMIVAVLVFFPVVVNVTRGLTQVEPAALELMRSYAASEWTVLRKVRIPNALPYFFTALKVGTTLSLIGAIVGEYFGGRASVLGRVIVAERRRAALRRHLGRDHPGGGDRHRHVPRIVAVERLVIPWHASMRRREATIGGGAAPWVTSAQIPGAGRDGQLRIRRVQRRWRVERADRCRIGRRPEHGPSAAAVRRAARPRWTRSGCSSSGRRRPSSPATSPPRSRATTRRPASTSTILDGGPEVIPQAVGSAADGPEFTISWVPKVLEAREGTPASDLVNIAQIFQRSGTLSVSWKESNIT